MKETKKSKRETWQLMLCPFHEDKSPSLAYNDERFICLACGQKGTVDDLHKELSRLKQETK